jgi:hypothetical protein
MLISRPHTPVDLFDVFVHVSIHIVTRRLDSTIGPAIPRTEDVQERVVSEGWQKETYGEEADLADDENYKYEVETDHHHQPAQNLLNTSLLLFSSFFRP